MPFYCDRGHKNQSKSRYCTLCGDSVWLPVGHIVENRYKLIKHLSAGGFGRTYLAEDLNRFNEHCVLKEFSPQEVDSPSNLEKAKELFEREAGALYKLQHPQLPGFREFFKADLGEGVGCLFLAQNYIDGKTYSELLKSSKRLSEADVTWLMRNLLPVLTYIHSEGVIHRDISPDNIILRSSDRLPVLIDLGGVKQLVTTAIPKLIQPAKGITLLGKQGYAPEEQLKLGQAYPSSDLYALAVTALVLLTGKEPQELYDSYHGTWLWRREIKVSSQLETVLQKMLAYKVGDRYQSAPAVLQALESPNTTTMPPERNISQLRTVILGVKQKFNHNSNHNQTGTSQAIAIPKLNFSWLRPWIFKSTPHSPLPTPHSPLPTTHSPLLTTHSPLPTWLRPWIVRLTAIGLLGLTAVGVWAFIQTIPITQLLPPSEQISPERTKKLFNRRQALKIQPRFFTRLTDDVFYAKHTSLNGRRLKPAPEDAALRRDWFNTAEELLDKLEQAKLSLAARRKLGSYTRTDYATWQQQANQGELGNYTSAQLKAQTDQKFYQLFPQQRGKKLKQQTFGQIWYAIAFDQVSQQKAINR